MQHLVFYDGNCGLCDHVVQFLLKLDKNRLFAFAPLQGITAKKMVKELPPVDSLVLIENYHSNPQTYLFGQAAFRILWLLGGLWALPGALSFLPPVLYDWGYRLIAANRYRFFSKDVCQLPDANQKERFLP